MELFAFFVGGGQTHHREIFSVFRKTRKKICYNPRNAVSHTKNKIKNYSVCSSIELSEYFFFSITEGRRRHMYGTSF